MKRNLKKFLITCSLIFIIGLLAHSQPPPPRHGENDDQRPAPIGNGLAILIGLGAIYGAKKIYDARKRLNDN